MYNRMGEALPVRTPLAEVVRYFGQEPDRWEGAGASRKAIWVLDDGSEIAIEFDNGLFLTARPAWSELVGPGAI